MPCPFTLPVRVEDDVYLVDANHELIMCMESATKEEIVYIIEAVNGYKQEIK